MRIMDDPDLSQRPAYAEICEDLVFPVNRDLGVYAGGACDSAGIIGAVPELKHKFFLGTLDESGFQPLLDCYRNNPPPGVELLTGITWSELAIRYGDKTNDEIFWLNDLPSHKWAAPYLLDKPG